MVSEGQSVTYVSQALGISENLIYRWRNKQRIYINKQADSNISAAEIEQLKARVKQLETERDILKKALSIFSRMS